MIIAISFLSGVLFIIAVLFLFIKFKPSKDDNAFYYKQHLNFAEKQLSVFNERMVEERRLADSLESIVKYITNPPSKPIPIDNYSKCAEDIESLDLADEVINKKGVIITILKRYF